MQKNNYQFVVWYVKHSLYFVFPPLASVASIAHGNPPRQIGQMYASNGSTNALAYTFADLNINDDEDGRITVATQGVAYMNVRVYMWGKYYNIWEGYEIDYLRGHLNYSPSDSEYTNNSTSYSEERFYMDFREDLIVMKNRYGVKVNGTWQNKIVVCENTVAYWNGTSTELND